MIKMERKKSRADTARTATFGIIGTSAAALILGLVAFPVPQTANALPAYAKKTGLSCGKCHVSPSGGGTLTAFGKAYAANGHKVPAREKDKGALNNKSRPSEPVEAKDKGALGNNVRVNKNGADKTVKSGQVLGFMQSQVAGEWRASKLIGASVIGPDNKSIGDINEIIINKLGDVEAVVIGVGGFLGIGEKNVAVPLEALDVQRKMANGEIEKITVAYSKQELKDAPKFEYYQARESNKSYLKKEPADNQLRRNAQPHKSKPR